MNLLCFIRVLKHCLIIDWICLIEALTGFALFACLVRGKVKETGFLDFCHFILPNTCLPIMTNNCIKLTPVDI